MGSWSVYCGISRISITSGDECVFLPLKKGHGDYLPYFPATLPIFGTYDDYGGIENIKEDKNTKLIEKHFKCTIHDFCYFFTRGCIRDDEDEFPQHLKMVDEIKNWKFMFISRAVYDHMSTYIHKGYGGQDSIDLGNEGILKLLGFEYVGHDDKETRYFQMWKYKNGEIFHSDGTWLHEEKYPSLYHYHQLKPILNLPDELDWVGEKTMADLWRYLDDEQQCEQLGWIFNKRYNFLRRNETPKTLVDKYFKKLEDFGDDMCGLISVRRNLHPMSGYFEPHILYLTPQCGDFDEHQKLLEKFAEINRKKGESLGYFKDDE